MIKISVFLLLLTSIAYGGTMSELQLISPAFKHNQSIPTVYTCKGRNKMIPLRWQGAPSETRTYALIMQDPDAPAGIWYHWVVYNIPVEYRELKKDTDLQQKNIQIGSNSWGHQSYGGPCPPSGVHRYYIYLYALNNYLDLPKGATAKQLEKAMKNHILAKAELMGKYP